MSIINRFAQNSECAQDLSGYKFATLKPLKQMMVVNYQLGRFASRWVIKKNPAPKNFHQKKRKLGPTYQTLSKH